MKIAIIGWYGTETIGDRAILAGLLKVLCQLDSTIEIELGSIYPFFTERTIAEDVEFINKICSRNITISIFNSRSHIELKRVIKRVDYVCVGGGPLMDVSWMYMIEYALMKAKKLKKHTALLGCGIGPLYKREYIKATANILKYSDFIILRDEESKLFAENIVPQISSKIYSIIDPAVFAASAFMMLSKDNISAKDFVAVNLRDFPSEYLKEDGEHRIRDLNRKVCNIVQDATDNDIKIRLIPMHYFAIGGDDRVFLNKIKNEIGNSNVIVQNEPLSLEETLKVFFDAHYCIGMRFHSVVLQTMVNGNNYIIDYTEPKRGKTSGFLTAIGGMQFYNARYINIQSSVQEKLLIEDKVFNMPNSRIIFFEEYYCKVIREYWG